METVMLVGMCCFCFFKQKTAYEMRISDWSSDVCSSDLARKQAAEPRTGPLAGVPTLIKDTLPEKGMPASLGAVALRDFIAPDDAPYTRAIADAGLISIARSSMPELGLNVVTESPLVGPTRKIGRAHV